MKFKVSTSILQKQLQAIGGALSSNTVLPILENFLFEIKGASLTISATDLQTSMTTTLAVESDMDGKIAIPSRILMDTLKTLPEQPLTFNIDLNTYSVELQAGAGKYKLAGENAEDFPRIAKVENAQKISIRASVLAEAVNKTLFAVSNDELRPAMGGVLFQLWTTGVTFVATDAHKLVRYHRSDIHSETDTLLILPKKALNLLKSSLPAEDVSVELAYDSNSAFFSFNNINLICRLIDERYPDYSAVIPQNNPNKLTVDRLQFLSALNRVVIYANKTTHQVRLRIVGTELNISSEDPDFSNEAYEAMTCEYVGEDMEIGFNAKFLIEMLKNLTSSTVLLEMSTANRAGILFPSDQEENEDVLMLVMPVMLNTYA